MNNQIKEIRETIRKKHTKNYPIKVHGKNEINEGREEERHKKG
jgi:hypothetical protein